MKALLLAATLLQASSLTVDEKARSSFVLTVYHDATAFVADTRKVDLPEGVSALRVEGVLPGADGDTVTLQAPGGKGFRVTRQTFLPKAVDTQTLLRQSVGRWVLSVRTDPQTGKDEVEAAELLSTDGGLVLRAEDRIDTNFPGRVALTDLPPGTRSQSVVEAEVAAGEDADSLLLSYLANGIGWRADYVAIARPDGTMDLRAFATVRNDTAQSLREIALRLVAGEVNRVGDGSDYKDRPVMRSMAMESAPPPPRQEPVGDYQLFVIRTPVTLEPNAANQFLLFGSPKASFERQYVLRSRVDLHPGPPDEFRRLRHPSIRMRVKNTKKNGLGVPFPRGEIRVLGGEGAELTFLGEASMQAVPEGEVAEWTVGEAFDLSVRRKQTVFENVGGKNRFGEPDARVVGYELKLSNAASQAKVLRIEEMIPGDWKILEASHPYTRASSGKAVFEVPVPAGKSVTLSYSARVE